MSENEDYSLNTLYTDFINSIGYGYFFGGSLVLFPLMGKTGSINALTAKLRSVGIKNFVAIGYQGTTEGYYCLKNDKRDFAIYWADIQQKIVEKLDKRFDNWINAQPNILFQDDIYAAYKKIRDIDSIHKVIDERLVVEVEMLDFDKQLVKPPGSEQDLLPRYNKITLAFRKNQSVSLNQLTIKFHRIGSPVGKDNIEYLTIDIASIPIGESVVIHGYLFDPFNLSFERIECNYTPEIDLSKKMRVKYKEIKQFL